MNREEIKNNAKLLEQLESLERLYGDITSRKDSGSWWKILTPNYECHLHVNATRDSFVKWLADEIKIIKIQIGE